GWEDDISSARTWAELPKAARLYCQRIADILRVPISMISVGAERNDLVALRWPIEK
ncbi:MAG: adenylosuccinate synthetase, partial [Chloroflexi bacterium]|nr:adenylosuccinate synthetase [Chloroflexota bacterium]